jgi:hypothetical protein
VGIFAYIAGTMGRSVIDGEARMLRPAVLVLATGCFVLMLSGCISSRGADIASSREILTAAEIARTTALTAYEAIQIRRPAFLARSQQRALRDADQPDARPIIYVNGVYFGEVESLHDISVRQVKDIRFMEANEATRTMGTTNVGGVIMVTTNLN